jgi:hypothetical protein
MMDVSGQAPTMQNISEQKGLYQQNMNGMKLLGQQALGQKPTDNSMQALAEMLRKKQPNIMGAGVPLPNSNINPYMNYDQSGGTNYGAGSVGGTGIE